MNTRCIFCTKETSFLKSIMMHTGPEEKEVRICFECVRIINNNTAHRYKICGWMITADALIVNNNIDLTKESA